MIGFFRLQRHLEFLGQQLPQVGLDDRLKEAFVAFVQGQGSQRGRHH